MRKVVVVILLFQIAVVAFAQPVATDSLLAVIRLDRRDSAHIDALIKLSQYYRGKDNTKAAYYFREVIRLSPDSPEWITKASIALGLISFDLGVIDSAEYYFDQAEKIISQHQEDKSLLSFFYNGRGLFYKKQGKMERALEDYFRLAELGPNVVGPENFAGNYLNIANTYNGMSKRREAIDFLYKALRAFEAIPSEKGISYCYNSLGGLLEQQGRHQEAEQYLVKSLAIKEKDKDLRGIANTCNQLTVVYVNLNQLDKAIVHVEKAISIGESLGIQELLAISLVHKVKILRLQGNRPEALKVLERATPIARSLENRAVLSQLQAEAGKIYSESKKGEEAVAALLSSINEAQKSRNVEALASAHQFLAQEYVRKGQYKEALEQYQQYYVLEDSIRGTKIKLDFKKLETQYELEKKNAEIALLRKDQELHDEALARQQAIQLTIAVALLSVLIIAVLAVNRYRVLNRSKRLLEIERVRNTIARDLHDDIGSTLSSINIISRLAETQTAPNVAAEHFKKISHHSSALMDRMSDIVWSINPANDSVAIMVVKMKEFTAEILEPKNIHYSFAGTETLNGETLGIEKKRNVFLVFKEAVNNAAKYSGSTRVEIEIRQNNQNLHICVRDNGRGFDPLTNAKGNGLRNMKERASAINGSLRIDSSPGNGTNISLSVPIT